MRLNYKLGYIGDYFEFKFKRKIKQWSLEELYNLYNAAYIRHKNRLEILKTFLEKIEKTKYERIYYHYNDTVICVKFFHQNNRFCYSENVLNFNTLSEIENRNVKLDYLIDTEDKFKLGEEYKKIEELQSSIHRNILHVIFDRIIDDILKPKYKNEQYKTINVKFKDLNLIFEIGYNGCIEFVKQITDVVEI